MQTASSRSITGLSLTFLAFILFLVPFFQPSSSVLAVTVPGPCSQWEPGRILPENCVPEGLAGRQTVKTLDVQGVWSVINSYIGVFLPLLASMAVAIIMLQATNIVAYASNDSKRKEAIKAIQWLLFGLLGSTLAYMIITSLIRGFYKLADG